MFSNTRGKGFALYFSNGWGVSVQWGPGNHCDRKWESFHAPGVAMDKGESWSSPDAEIAVFMPSGEFYPLANYDDVKGWVDTDTVAKLITAVSSVSPLLARERSQLAQGADPLNIVSFLRDAED